MNHDPRRASPPTGDEAWDAFAAALGDLRAVADLGDAELERRLGRAATALGAIVEGAGGRARPGLEEALDAELEHLERDARAFFRDELEEVRHRGRGAAILRFRARALRRAARALLGRASADELPFLLRELREVEDLAGEDPEEAEGADDVEAARDPWARLDDEAHRLRTVLLERRVEEMERRREAIDPGARDGALAAFFLGRELEGLRQRLDEDGDRLRERGRNTRASSLESLDASVRDARRLSEEGFLTFAAGARAPEDLEAVRDAASRLVGELDEARLGAADRRGATPPRRLRRLAEQGRRFARALVAPIRAAAPARTSGDEGLASSLKRYRRRLLRLSRRLDDLASDRVLDGRLAALFGRRTTRVWGVFVTWLIVLLLGLIVVNHYRDPDVERGLDWTVWADTAICCVLLLDFFTRTALHPDRGRYFLRHALTDFLPSLPVGVLVILHHRGLGVLRAVFVAPRAVRLLRLLQPLVRLFRLALFFARAADRLVERNAWLLDRDIVFFAAGEEGPVEHALVERIRDLDGWVRREVSALASDLETEEQIDHLDWKLRAVAASSGMERMPPEEASPLRRSGGRIDVDLVVRRLRSVDERQVAEALGIDFARSLTSALRLFGLPGLRRVPVIRFVLGPTGAPDPLATTARLARVAGDALAAVQRGFNWFADLHGTITGAQFLDRMGMQLVKATSRPAKRLVLFAFAVAAVWLLVKLLDRRGALQTLVDAAVGFLSTPLVVIGVLCFVPLVVGLWLRRVAGQAVDFYERVAEAQYLSLTEVEKEKEAPEHRRSLLRRVVFPELRLSRGLTDPATLRRLETLALESPEGLGTLVRDPDARLDGGVAAQVGLLHREFLDGSPFHRNDTKVASMLLGNLALENVRRHRLRFDRRRRQRLERLDIARGRGGITGPVVWFNFITHAVAQETARLVIEYNRHGIPLDERETADPRDRARLESWLERRRRLSEARSRGVALREDPPLRQGATGTLSFRTTEFNSLHFLTADPERDEAVARRYGAEFRDLLVEDREHLVRTVFGTFPMDRLPLSRRSFNAYRAWMKYGSRGRVFFLPFVGAWFLLKGLRLVSGRLLLALRDVVDPDARPLESNSGRASFEVARRKVHRMRRPVVLEAMRLRAELDLEYLGLSLPGRDEVELEPEVDELTRDLRSLDASEREWEEFREIRSRGRHRLRLLAALVRETAGDLAAVEESLGGSPEALRAFATAFVCDHEGTATLCESLARLRDLHERPGLRRTGRRFGGALAEIHRRRLRPRIDACRELLFRSSETVEDETLDALARALTVRGGEFEHDLEVVEAALEDGPDPLRRALQSLVDTGRRPSSWTEQIVAVRTVQTLGLLDLRGYERLIRVLGRYEGG